MCYVHTQLTQLISAVSPFFEKCLRWNDFLNTYNERCDKQN